MDEATKKRLMAELGEAGGHARAAALTQEQRSEIARKAAKKRWRGRKKSQNKS